VRPDGTRDERHTSTREGVADLGRRRVRVAQKRLSEALQDLEEQFARKVPWLEDEDEDETDEPTVSVYIGGAHFFGARGRWTGDASEVDGPRWHTDPTWILDALAGACNVRAGGPDEVRGVATERHSLTVDLKAAEPLRLPYHGRVHRPTLRAEVWVDGSDLIRRAAWTQPLRGRRRERDRAKPAPHAWTTVELWDFGLPVQVEVPAVEPKPRFATARVLLELRRRRAAYRRSR
jgi:hypothetical protein